MPPSSSALPCDREGWTQAQEMASLHSLSHVLPSPSLLPASSHLPLFKLALVPLSSFCPGHKRPFLLADGLFQGGHQWSPQIGRAHV